MPEITLPRRPESVAVACDAVEACVREAGWAQQEVDRVVLAVGEAVGNAVEHGPPSSGIEVRFGWEAARLVVRVNDGGTGPAMKALDHPTLPDDPMATEGRGLFILASLTDALTIDSEGGLCLTFVASE